MTPARQADALSAYQRVRTTLNDELGLEPGPQLRAIQQQILNQDPALDPPPPARAGLAAYKRAAHGYRLIVLGGALLLAAAIAAAMSSLHRADPGLLSSPQTPSQRSTPARMP